MGTWQWDTAAWHIPEYERLCLIFLAEGGADFTQPCLGKPRPEDTLPLAAAAWERAGLAELPPGTVDRVKGTSTVYLTTPRLQARHR